MDIFDRAIQDCKAHESATERRRFQRGKLGAGGHRMRFAVIRRTAVDGSCVVEL